VAEVPKLMPKKVFKSNGRYGVSGTRPASLSKVAVERQGALKKAQDHGWHPEEVKEEARRIVGHLLNG